MSASSSGSCKRSRLAWLGNGQAIPRALAAYAEQEHEVGNPFQIGVITGASTGASLDGALARADADPGMIYLVAKTIYENRAQIAEMHRAGAEITPERAAMDIGIPYHEGALRYFNEIGIWKPAAKPAAN